MRYRAVVSYFGKNYVGWQKQLNGVSVQEKTEQALSAVFGVPTPCTASGRTDAGVHAEGQVIHFDADTAIPPEKIPFAVNTELPRDISMLSCEPVADDFNARFAAKRKTYRYSLYVARHRRPVLDGTRVHIVVPLDLAAVRECAAVIEGEHDFKAFEASGSVVKNTVRTVYSVEVRAEGRIDGNILVEGTVDIEVTYAYRSFRDRPDRNRQTVRRTGRFPRRKVQQFRVARGRGPDRTYENQRGRNDQNHIL